MNPETAPNMTNRYEEYFYQKEQKILEATVGATPQEAASIVVSEIMEMLPLRYAVGSGLVFDERGNTAGPFDVVIYNSTWFAPLLGETTAFPIESVYCVIDVVSSLTSETLAAAIKKLGDSHRLQRFQTFKNQISENRSGEICVHGLTNPLYSAILALGVSPPEYAMPLSEQFIFAHKGLKRMEFIRGLCILGKATITWGYLDDNAQPASARFMLEDLYRTLIPGLSQVPPMKSALSALMADLDDHLYRSVLDPNTLIGRYLGGSMKTKFPVSSNVQFPADPEWLAKLEHHCSEHRDEGSMPDTDS